MRRSSREARSWEGGREGTEEGEVRMSMKKHLIAAVLVVLPLVAGCQQRTNFDACVEYYEQSVKGTDRWDPGKPGSVDLPKFGIWDECSG